VPQVAFRKHATPDAVTVEILVDGRLLTDHVRDAESESATREGNPDLAGKYGGLPWETIPTGLLLGEATGIWRVLETDQGDRVPVLICECREPGCWPLMATIEVTADRVTWSDFRQPYRKHWDHSTLGPFSFDKSQYLTALEEARRLTRED
jgi:hypothetical protein